MRVLASFIAGIVFVGLLAVSFGVDDWGGPWLDPKCVPLDALDRCDVTPGPGAGDFIHYGPLP